MSDDESKKKHPFRPEEMDLKQLTVEELSELKDAIMARARERVGPAGFNPVMMDTGDFRDWWDLLIDPADYIGRMIDVASRRVSLAVMTVGVGAFGVYAGGTERLAPYGTFALGVTAALGAWFIVEMTRGVVKPIFRG